MNKIKTIIGGLLLTIGVCGAGNMAKASVIRIDTDKTSYQTGEWITATLRTTDTTDTLMGFFLALQYQTGQLVLQDFSFGEGFDDGFGSYRFFADDALDGRLALEEYADGFADLGILATKQPAGFFLASVRFKATSSGLFSLDLDPSYLGLITSTDVILTPDVFSASFQVTNGATVPAPATALLLIPAVLFLTRRRR